MRGGLLAFPEAADLALRSPTSGSYTRGIVCRLALEAGRADDITRAKSWDGAEWGQTKENSLKSGSPVSCRSVQEAGKPGRCQEVPDTNRKFCVVG